MQLALPGFAVRLQPLLVAGVERRHRLFAAGDIDHALLQSHTIALLERGLESSHAP